MVAGLSSIIRYSLLGAVLAALPTSATDTAAVQPTGVQSAGQEYVRFMPEVRLRKLHLVRPDLIPFPIAYEVCC